MKLVTALFLLLWLAGCAVGPRFDTRDVVTELTPPLAAARGDAAVGQRVLWAGVILDSTNLPDATRLEVLGYPVDQTQAPRVEATPTGRFLILQEGYLETADYRPGRRVTVLGAVTDTQPGRIGEAEYLFPLVTPDSIHLWDTALGRTEPRVRFGVGVIFSR